MPEVAVLNAQGEESAKLALSEAVFGAKLNMALVHQVVKAQLANRRQGTAKTKERSEVSGGGVKPWRQKGTGRARAGSIRSPLWRHGGTLFGPRPRDYNQAIPKKMKRRALREVLSAKLRDGELFVVEEVKFEQPRTKAAVEWLENLGFDVGSQRVLVVMAQLDRPTVLSLRNIPRVSLRVASQLCPLDLLVNRWIVLTRDAVEHLEARLK